jgi:hypothetical protein
MCKYIYLFKHHQLGIVREQLAFRDLEIEYI